MTSKCALCDGDRSSQEYCVYHSKAFENISATYKIWKGALDLSWKEYLIKISEMSETGSWAREVALYESKK